MIVACVVVVAIIVATTMTVGSRASEDVSMVEEFSGERIGGSSGRHQGSVGGFRFRVSTNPRARSQWTDNWVLSARHSG